MPTSERQFRPDIQGALGTILLAIESHPDAALRARLDARLDEWLDEIEPSHSREQVAEALASPHHRGTPLEPFALDEAGRRLATIAVRAAFSRAHRQTRVRIVSCETLGVHGGLVLTNNLRGYYVERFALARRRRTTWKHWYIAPAARPGVRASARSKPGFKAARPLSVACDLTEAGWQIALPASATPTTGYLLGTERSIPSLGLRVSHRGGRYVLEPTGPEAMVRLAALALSRPWLVLSDGNTDDAGGWISVTHYYVQLLPMEAVHAQLPLVVATVGASDQWLSVAEGAAPALPFHEQLAVARHYPVPDDWITSEFLEPLSPSA